MKQKKVVDLNFFLLPQNGFTRYFWRSKCREPYFKSVGQRSWMIWIKKIVISEYRKSSFDWVNVHIFFFWTSLKTFLISKIRKRLLLSVLDCSLTWLESLSTYHVPCCGMYHILLSAIWLFFFFLFWYLNA